MVGPLPSTVDDMTDWLTSHGGVHGQVAEGFEPVAQVFVDNFADRNETGASACVYVDGERVVNIWGGAANHKTNEPWREESAIVVSPRRAEGFCPGPKTARQKPPARGGFLPEP